MATNHVDVEWCGAARPQLWADLERAKRRQTWRNRLMVVGAVLVALVVGFVLGGAL